MNKDHVKGQNDNKKSNIQCDLCDNSFFSSREYMRHIIYVNGKKICKLSKDKH